MFSIFVGVFYYKPNTAHADGEKYSGVRTITGLNIRIDSACYLDVHHYFSAAFKS